MIQVEYCFGFAFAGLVVFVVVFIAVLQVASWLPGRIGDDLREGSEGLSGLYYILVAGLVPALIACYVFGYWASIHPHDVSIYRISLAAMIGMPLAEICVVFFVWIRWR